MIWRDFVVVGYVVSWAMIPVVLRANKPPVSTLNWIWVMFLFPWLGPIAYFLFGSDHLARKHLNKREELDAVARPREHRLELLPAVRALLATLPASEQAAIGLLSSFNEAVVSAAQEVELLVDAQTFYPSLLSAIAGARHHVHAEFYILRNDRYGTAFRDALAEAARRGVEVRLLCDQMGSFGLGDVFFDSLVAAGGEIARFRTVHPLQNRWVFNLRNHRKIQIIDGETAFVGGMNMGREYMGEDPTLGAWRDVQIRIHGQAATTVQRTFVDDWFYATDKKLTDDAYFPVSSLEARIPVQILSDGPDNDADPIQMSIVAQLNDARRNAWLTAGYFVPNEPLLTAMKLCAGRGVDLRLLVSATTDHPYLVQVGRSYYEELLEYGVKIYEYGAGVNHAKVATFDGRWMMVGSANFDVRSMRLNFELNAVVDDPASTQRLEAVLREDYEQRSKRIELSEFRLRPYKQRCLESLFRPLAPLL